MTVFKKTIIKHQDFYIAAFSKKEDAPYLVFIHGGPGFNCGTIEYLIEHNKFFDCLDHNIILYDQRNCGRSKKISDNVLHQDNVDDLQEIIQHLNLIEIKVQGLIGHSYGAKLLFDFYSKFHSTIPGIFISTANSILIPRLNNLILDLAYLKKTDRVQYNETFQTMDSSLDLKKIWSISEKLTPLFQENKDRSYLYWANLECFEAIKEIQKKINLPTDTDTFVSVRKDLYSTESNFSVDINSLTIPSLWVNGFHDFIMNGSDAMLSNNSKVITFYQSSHYPHLEENDRFSKLINEFIQNQRN